MATRGARGGHSAAEDAATRSRPTLDSSSPAQSERSMLSSLASLSMDDPHWDHVMVRLRSAEPIITCLVEGNGAPPNRSLTEALARVMKASEAPDKTRAALRAAFIARALNALSDIVGELDDAALSRAAGAGSGRSVLFHALEPISTAAAAKDEDPLAAARLRGLKARDQMLGAEGGTLSVSRVAEHLRISRQAVDKRRRSGKLIGFDVGRHGHAYPAWQFDERGVLPGLDAVLAAMQVRDPWMQAAFFLSGDPRLAGDTPLSRLRRGDVDAVVLAARGYGQHGAA